jgi:ATP-dependent DNA helicase DinG
LQDNKNFVKYFERSGNNVEIKAAPLSVARHLKEYVYDNFSSVVMTSATLTVNKEFDFFADRCGTSLIDKENVGYHLLKSSFDYEKQVRFFVPKGIAYSEGKDLHLGKSADFLEKAIIASNGGALILCTSHKQVDALYDLLDGPLSKNNICLFRQSKDVSVGGVVRDFKRDMNSALIGTESLWQGIDVPGMSLRSLFIYKVLYRMPFHPLIKARRQEIEDQGGDGFVNYYEPLAALMLKQGFGRLIRKRTDSGIAVLLDEDLLNRPRLLNSLPEGVFPKKIEPEEIYKEFSKFAKGIISEKGSGDFGLDSEETTV